VTVVSDTGPILALAKTGGLSALFGLFPAVLTAPAVYEEAVTEGLRLGAPDALLLQEHYQSGSLTVRKPAGTSLPRPALLGCGEEESILLAIELKASWLLVDDLDARRAALANFEAAGVHVQVKGTLGVVIAAVRSGNLSRTDARAIVGALNQRPDVWISTGLCERAISEIERD
jgi:uncharacterized protein